VTVAVVGFFALVAGVLIGLRISNAVDRFADRLLDLWDR
jgi:hypothetical protein